MDAWEAAVARGIEAVAAGRFDEAAAAFRLAVADDPGEPSHRGNLGESLRRAGRPADAVPELLTAVEIAPRFAEGWLNLGRALRDLDRDAQAEDALRKALELKPHLAAAGHDLGDLLLRLDRPAEAVDAYRKSLAARPDRPETLGALAVAFSAAGLHDEALAAWDRLATIDPARKGLAAGKADALVAAGRTAEAREILLAESARKPHCLAGRMRAVTTVEVVAPTDAYPDEIRAELTAELDAWEGRPAMLDPTRLHTTPILPPPALAAHGRDDRALKERFAALYRRTLPETSPPPCPTGKPTVAIRVARGREAAFERDFGDLADALPSADLDVFLAATAAGVRTLQRLRPERKCPYLVLPEDVPSAAETLRSRGVDLVHYCGHGTDPAAYFLPFFRPAPVQTAGWGDDATTGLAEIDAFILCDEHASPEADSHFMERLFRLPQDSPSPRAVWRELIAAARAKEGPSR